MQIRSRDIRTPQLDAPATLIEAALQGFDNPEASTNAIWSSQVWMAFYAGQAQHAHGYTRPNKITAGRGYSVNLVTAANKFKVEFRRDLTACTVERL